VALFSNGKVLASKSKQEEGYSHAENIMSFIDEVLSSSGLSKTDLDAISVSGGPGSYTGLRIGVATAKGISNALSIPLIAIDTLSVLYKEALSLHPNNDAYVAMLDARRMEVYTRTFSSSTPTPVEPLVVDDTTHSRFSTFTSICFIGDGALKCQDLLGGDNRNFIEAYPKADYALELATSAFDLGQFVDVASYEPLYLKAFKAGVAKDPFNLRDKTSRFAQ
jgi:tRNA threonylcarbamoyladenosine biosynthesis protein TsaB